MGPKEIPAKFILYKSICAQNLKKELFKTKKFLYHNVFVIHNNKYVWIKKLLLLKVPSFTMDVKGTSADDGSEMLPWFMHI
jgi:hypothetical protein